MAEGTPASLDIVASWEGGYRCRIPVREFELAVDEPARYGGTNSGPMPTELFLASLAGCFALAVAHVARKRGVELPDLTVRARGEYAGLRFGRIRLEVESSHPREDLEPMIQRAVNFCYVSNTLRHPPELEVVTAGRDATHAAPPPRD